MKKFLKFIVCVIVVIALVYGYARYLEPSLLITKKIQTSSNVIPENVRVVFFTDTHFGKFYSEKNVEKIVKKINNQNPDIVILGGDLMDSFYRDQVNTNYITKHLNKIKAKYGKYSVWGNHDYGGGAVRIYEKIMEDSGFKLLKNNYIKIDELNITVAGLDDYLLGNPDKSLAHELPSDYYNMMVSHAPDIVDTLNLENCGLVLSGHTHGGQVTVPFLTVLPPGGKNYAKGKYDVIDSEKNDVELFVSSGIGLTQLPFRFFNVPEIVVVDIKAK